MSDNPDKWNIFTAQDLAPITPDDDADLTLWARAIRCTGTGGTLRITTLRGNVRNTSIKADEVLVVAARRVHETGTSATELEALV